MELRTWINFAVLIILILAQVLICNHIFFFNVAMVFIFIYTIITSPINMKTDWLLTWAFLSGLAVDIFSDTPGVNSLACTLIAMAKRPLFYAYVPRDDRTIAVVPSIHSLGFGVFSKYLFSMCAIYCFTVFFIEYLNFSDVKEILIMSITSSIATFLVLLGINCLMSSKK